MSCPVCHKGPRAVLYCSRMACPGPVLVAAGVSAVPEHARFNLLLGEAKNYEKWIKGLSEAAYAIAQNASVGARAELIHLGDAASTFAGLIARMKPLP